MAVTFRSVASNTSGSGTVTSITVSLPSGVQVNDCLLACVTAEGGTATTITAPAGWALLTTVDQGTNIKTRVYWRLANGQEAADYTWTLDPRQVSACIIAYSDAVPFLPSSVASNSNATLGTSITPAGTNSSYTGLAVTFIGTKNTSAQATITPSSGFTERLDTTNTISAYMNLHVQDIAKGLGIGGTSVAAATSTQSVRTTSVTVFLEDLHLATITPPAVDSYQCASFSTSSTSTNLTKFSTNYPNELLIAVFIITKDAQTVSSVTNTSGLTWVNVTRANTQSGSVEVWRAFAPSPLTNQTITATLSGSAVSGNSMVAGFVGVDLTGTNGSGAIGAVQTANGTNSTPTVTLTTTRDNAFVMGAWNNPSQNSSTTAGASQTLIRAVGDATNTCSSSVNIVTNLIATAGGSGTISAATSMTAWNAAAIEILPAIRKQSGTLGVG